MIDDETDDDDVIELARYRCCVPRCRREARGLYCAHHLAMLAKLEAECACGDAHDDACVRRGAE